MYGIGGIFGEESRKISTILIYTKHQFVLNGASQDVQPCLGSDFDSERLLEVQTALTPRWNI